MMRELRRILVPGAMLVAIFALAAPAWAHVSVTPGEVPASGHAKLDFQVQHGCDGSATVAVAIQIPTGVISVTPQVVPGWEIDMEEGPLAEPVAIHGETITQGVTKVTWSGGPLADHHLEEFGMSVQIEADGTDILYFPVVQTCEEGEAAWIEIPAEADEELDHPAPAVALTTASHNDHGDETSEEATDDEADENAADEEANHAETEVTVAGGEAAGPSDSSSSDGTDTVAWVGVILGGLGAVLGGAALVSGRRRSTGHGA